MEGVEELDDDEYDVEHVSIGQFPFQLRTLACDSLPLEKLLELEAAKTEISGQRLWEGSLLLGSYLTSADGSKVSCGERKRVLELGCGCGLVGMLCCKLGAPLVHVTDGDERSVSLAAGNLIANDCKGAAASLLHFGDWCALERLCNAPARAEEEPPPQLELFDLVLAGDVLYKSELLEPLLSTVKQALAPGGLFVLCHIPRAGVTHDMVREALKSSGFGYERVQVDPSEVEANNLCKDDAMRASLYLVTLEL
ncbi:unnamed protein product [Chrysoparadoxa australica]